MVHNFVPGSRINSLGMGLVDTAYAYTARRIFGFQQFQRVQRQKRAAPERLQAEECYSESPPLAFEGLEHVKRVHSM